MSKRCQSMSARIGRSTAHAGETAPPSRLRDILSGRSDIFLTFFRRCTPRDLDGDGPDFDGVESRPPRALPRETARRRPQNHAGGYAGGMGRVWASRRIPARFRPFYGRLRPRLRRRRTARRQWHPRKKGAGVITMVSAHPIALTFRHPKLLTVPCPPPGGGAPSPLPPAGNAPSAASSGPVARFAATMA